MRPIHVDLFRADGRGPDLRRVCWDAAGVGLLAIEYHNPDDAYDEASLKHVRFEGVQVVLITPEEVIDYAGLGPRLAEAGAASMFDLGQSAWLRSFAPRHLSACSHVRLLFYDQLFDVICEGVACHRGGFRP